MEFSEVIRKLLRLPFQMVRERYTSLLALAIEKGFEANVPRQVLDLAGQISDADKQPKLEEAQRLLREWLSLKTKYQWVYNANRIFFEILGFLVLQAGPLLVVWHYKEIPANSLAATSLFSLLCVCFYLYFAMTKREVFQKLLNIRDTVETLQFHPNNGEFFGFASVALISVPLFPILWLLKPHDPLLAGLVSLHISLGLLGSVANHFWSVNFNSVLSMYFSFGLQRVADGRANLLILSSQTTERVNSLSKDLFAVSRMSKEMHTEIVDNLQKLSKALKLHVFLKCSKPYRTRFSWCSEKAFELSERMYAEVGNPSVRDATTAYLSNLCKLILENNLGGVESSEKYADKTSVSSFSTSLPMRISTTLSLIAAVLTSVLLVYQFSVHNFPNSFADIAQVSGSFLLLAVAALLISVVLIVLFSMFVVLLAEGRPNTVNNNCTQNTTNGNQNYISKSNVGSVEGASKNSFPQQ
jgi:hypothetical protein